MQATAEATEAYHRKHPGLHTSILGRTQLRVSGAGFGGYRVSVGVDGHRQALRTALSSGINLIDTSANYADGGSEELIGEVLADLGHEGSVSRSNVVVVSKGGYIQGSNYTMARERVEAGSGFQDVVEYASGLWHCISPEFLHDQITRSLARLKLGTIDVYLLHNPEYYLNHAAKHGVPLADARREYYHRIRVAFEHLETEVTAGRIAWYGISSNSFPHAADDANFTSLDEVARIADDVSPENHFAVIQLPANLGETGFVTERNQPGDRSLMDLAHEHNLGVLINRPLNVIAEDQLVRMADFPLTGVAVTREMINTQITRLVADEQIFAETRLGDFADDLQAQQGLREFITVGLTMQKHWDTFGSIEHFNDVLSQHFAPRLGYITQYLRQRDEEQHINWYATYLHDARALLHTVSLYYSQRAQERSNQIRQEIEQLLDKTPSDTLSALSVRLLLGVEGVNAVLVGMRREEYVADVLGALQQGPLGNQTLWQQLDLESILTDVDNQDDDGR